MGRMAVKRNRTREREALREKAKGGPAPGATTVISAAVERARKHALLLAAVVGVTFLAYANSFHAPFLVDNTEIVLNDTRVHSVTAEHVHRIFTQQYWETFNNGLYRPLTTLSFLFNYAVLDNGTDPFGYHCCNFILHAVNIVLVYLLGLAIFKRIPPALLMSTLWALHPVLTESVTNIVGRSDMLAAFGVLAALLCHREAIGAAGRRKAAWLAAIALASAIGIFSKESGIVVVAVFAIYDFAFVREVSWRSRVPNYAAAAVPCFVYLCARALVLASAAHIFTPFNENPLMGAGFWTVRMTAIKVVGRYFALLLWPARLSWDYGYNEVPLFGWNLGGGEDWKAIAALLGCAAAAALAVRFRRSSKPVFFAMAFFFVTLSPTSNLLIRIGAIMAERFLYLPAVGFAIVVVWALDALWRRVPSGQPAYRHAARIVTAILLIGCAARTYARNGDWADPQRFWLSAVAAAPDSAKTNMAAATNATLATREEMADSVHYADRALAILDGLPDSMNSPSTYSDAGLLYLHLGDKIAAHDAAAISAAGSDASYWYRKSLGALLRSEKMELARDERYRTENAARGIPGITALNGKLYLRLGRAYSRLADAPRALAALERGRELESAPDLLEELASAYRAAGEPRRAAQALVESLAMDPNRPATAAALVDLYAQIDPNGCSVTRQGGAPSLNPDCPLVHGDICAASRNVIGNYLRRGQPGEADSIRDVAERELGCAAGLLQ
jgi:tetratricopeptide (TPR) repeat protein